MKQSEESLYYDCSQTFKFHALIQNWGGLGKNVDKVPEL